MLRKEVVVAYGESSVQHINTMCGKSTKFSVLNLVVYVLTTSVYWSGDTRVAPHLRYATGHHADKCLEIKKYVVTISMLCSSRKFVTCLMQLSQSVLRETN